VPRLQPQGQVEHQPLVGSSEIGRENTAAGSSVQVGEDCIATLRLKRLTRPSLPPRPRRKICRNFCRNNFSALKFLNETNETNERGVQQVAALLKNL